jgi:hypothetical protein
MQSLDSSLRLAAVQAVEIGNAVDPEQHRLAIDHERTYCAAEKTATRMRVAESSMPRFGSALVTG